MINQTDVALNLRKLSHVPRCHTCFSIDRQSVAEHSHSLSMLLLYYYHEFVYHCTLQTEFVPEPLPKMIKRAILHDYTEIYTGDIPHPVKVCLPEGSDRSLLEFSKVCGEGNFNDSVFVGMLLEADTDKPWYFSWFDMLEFLLSRVHEYRIGNSTSEKHIDVTLLELKKLFQSNMNSENYPKFFVEIERGIEILMRRK